MKKYFCVFFLSFCIVLLANAQDIIMKTNGEELKVKVKSVNTKDVEYKATDNPDGPSFTILKSDILMIKYANGTKDVFTSAPTSNSSTSMKFQYALIVCNIEDGNISVYIENQLKNTYPITKKGVTFNTEQVTIKISTILNELGSQGWEIKSSSGFQYWRDRVDSNFSATGLMIYLSREVK